MLRAGSPSNRMDYPYFFIDTNPKPALAYHPAPKTMSNTRCESVFTGRVQGVGFRATTLRLAQPLRITGFVRNQPDGSVYLVAEGPAEEIHKLHSTITDTIGHLIHNRTDRFSTPTDEFTDFDIRR